MKQTPQQKTDWKDELLDLVTQEIHLATGSRTIEHFSGTCKMNDIIEFVENLLAARDSYWLKKKEIKPIFKNILDSHFPDQSMTKIFDPLSILVKDSKESIAYFLGFKEGERTEREKAEKRLVNILKGINKNNLFLSDWIDKRIVEIEKTFKIDYIYSQAMTEIMQPIIKKWYLAGYLDIKKIIKTI